MRLIIFGAPGSGKGTQAEFICKEFGIPKVSTGDMLRLIIAEGGELGAKISDILKKGELVSDDMIIRMVEKRLQDNDCKKGFLFDGFPRTLLQAKGILNSAVDIDAIIELEVADEIILERLSGRRVHIPSGRAYHVVYNPPKTSGIDDITGESLVHREDDKEETIRNRLRIYRDTIDAIRQVFTDTSKIKYLKIKADGDLYEIANTISAHLKEVVHLD